jgi:hypothetical protein
MQILSTWGSATKEQFANVTAGVKRKCICHLRFPTLPAANIYNTQPGLWKLRVSPSTTSCLPASSAMIRSASYYSCKGPEAAAVKTSKPNRNNIAYRCRTVLIVLMTTILSWLLSEPAFSPTPSCLLPTMHVSARSQTTPRFIPSVSP